MNTKFMPAALHIDTGSLWYSVADDGIRHYERGPLLARGYCEADIRVHDERKSVEQVAQAIRERIKADPECTDFSLEWIHPATGREQSPWPDNARIVISVEQGGSEGWYIEIYALTFNAGRRDWTAVRLVSIKTFERERIWDLARRISRWLDLT